MQGKGIVREEEKKMMKVRIKVENKLYSFLINNLPFTKLRKSPMARVEKFGSA